MARAPLVDRAVRLFEFLGSAQQLKNRPPRTLDAYPTVLWLGELPRHPAVVVPGDPEPDDPVLVVDRVPRPQPPPVDDELLPWLDGPVDDPARLPALRNDERPGLDRADLDGADLDRPEIDRPDLDERFAAWLVDWRAWAERELAERPVRALYGELFSAYVAQAGRPEELELVVGVGCLTWTPPDHPPVRRHLLTAPVDIAFDDDTGRLTVRRVDSLEAISVELDMVDPGRVPNPQPVNEVRAQARVAETHPLHRDASGALARRLVHSLDAAGEYRDAGAPPVTSPHAQVTFAPAVILRRRSQQGLVDIFQTIAEQLAETGTVPDGLLPLVDPDHQPAPLAPDGQADGALVVVDGAPFLPLPVNDVQLRILRQVDTRAQTLVQGPPGTGKTHTAAALLSHLLAQGKRVLVTAHTDRALKEVRDKLPRPTRPLRGAGAGTSRRARPALKVAADHTAATAADQDAERARRTVELCLDTVESLRHRRSELYSQLVAAREHEVREHEHRGYRGTLASIARQLRAEAGRFGWLTELVAVGADADCPLTADELREWHGHLCDARLAADEAESGMRLVDRAALPEPQRFADLVATETASAQTVARLAALTAHPAFGPLRRLQPPARGELRRRLHQLATEADELAARREPWLGQALSDVLSGRAGVWQARAAQISDLARRSGPLIDHLGPMTEVRLTGGDGDIGPLVAMAQEIQPVLAAGKLKTLPGGAPKFGPFTPKVLRHAQPLFDAVRVDGLPPTTPDRLAAFLVWAQAHKALAALDRGWPGPPRAVEDTLHERWQQHVAELDQLHRVLRLGHELGVEERRLAAAGLPRPDWRDLAAMRTYASLVDAAAAADALAAAEEPLRRLADAVADAARWADAAPCVHQLDQAVRERDHDEYAAGYRRLERLDEVRQLTARRDALAGRLPSALRAAVEQAAVVQAAVVQAAADPMWTDRIDGFEHAWAWAAASTWIRQRGDVDVNALQAELTSTERRIREQVEILAATRAWGHAVSPDRLTGQARANLEHYAYLVRRLGKGTGKYADQRRAEIRQAMDRCRPAVPVWIMPVYRIADQLRIEPNMFDVVIVDEASQAGLEATFLQYLAPRVVVIGDDKQVSPAAVGVDQQQLRDLAGHYLADDPYRSSWQDPQRSLFDEAKMRFGGLLTLTEHRRCVPEIIGFSNRVAYEPEGIRLVPVRQYGADRLEPIKTVYLPDGRALGVTNKVNPVEAAAIVDQIEKCIADPRYDGLTFGVISLLGVAQAKEIHNRLLERVPPEEWRARDLRCGDSADFQGSERDVMFLSMVASTPEPDRRLGVLTARSFVQRYNVAASRAKDQMWLYHSVSPAQVEGNVEDMRFQLLDYCYGVAGSPDVGTSAAVPVPEDRLVEPFESLFEQQVFNRLAEFGYAVVPKHAVEPYRLDLLVVGAKTRLAIECDGDTWSGPQAYGRDLALQRDLERSGWRFFRIRESDFYVGEAAVLAGLQAALRELDIHPQAR